MGGTVPLGYVNRDKKLIIAPEEAESVRWIFQRYLEVGAIGPLLQDLDRAGIKTKPRRHASGRIVGGGRFGKGGLNHLLKNRCYIGEIVHRGEIHAGDHEPIVDRALFDAVQAKMAANNVEKRLILRGSPYLLTGLLFDSAGHRMTPSHTIKKGVRYRYYVSQALEQRRAAEAGVVGRVPAPDIEDLIGRAMAERLGSPEATPDREILQAHVQKVTIQVQTVEVTFRRLGEAPETKAGAHPAGEMVTLKWSRKPFVMPKGIALEPSEASAPDSQADRGTVLAAIGKARLWLDEIIGGGSIAEVAQRERKGERQVRLLLRLAFTPPKTVRSLIDGTDRPPTVTALAKNVPLIWP
jgi:hypothetical protein